MWRISIVNPFRSDSCELGPGAAGFRLSETHFKEKAKQTMGSSKRPRYGREVWYGCLQFVKMQTIAMGAPTYGLSVMGILETVERPYA